MVLTFLTLIRMVMDRTIVGTIPTAMDLIITWNILLELTFITLTWTVMALVIITLSTWVEVQVLASILLTTILLLIFTSRSGTLSLCYFTATTSTTIMTRMAGIIGSR